MSFQTRILAIFFLLVATSSASAQSDIDLAANGSDQGQAQQAALQQLLDDFEEFELQENPVTAGFFGVEEAKSKMPSVTYKDQQRRMALTKGFLTRLEKIDLSALPTSQKLDAEIFAWMLKGRVALARHDDQRLPGSSLYSTFSDGVRLAQATVILSKADAQAWINRLEDLPRYHAEQIGNLKRGVETGWTHPDFVVDVMIEQMKELLATQINEEHPLMTPLAKLPGNISDEEQDRLRKRARKVIFEKVGPSIRQALNYVEKDYRPRQRAGDGIHGLEGGAAYYQDQLHFYTSLELSPRQVHETGLAEVSRIRSEMQKVIEESGFEGSFAEFQNFLKSDPQFYASSAEQLLQINAAFAKRADGEMPKLFKTLPRAPYTVKAMPAAIAPSSTTAYYQGGNYKQGRAGTYVVNTSKLDQRPLYEVPALTLHEAVPGHHHQGMLAMEQEEVPPFRNRLYIIAFGEGWALYAESLGYEMGLYETPYDKFGQLSYEMWRACRLVADTGLHWKGWTRKQAQKYFEENTALSQANIEAEVMRYASWPGQALGYKIGQMKISELRKRAEEKLGDQFDIREFHDAVLLDGALPLSILETKIEHWIKMQSK